MEKTTASPRALAIGGLGSVGRSIVEQLDQLTGYVLTAVSARDVNRAQSFLSDCGLSVPVVPLEELSGYADVVVECAPASCFEQIATPTIDAGKILVVLSVGALLDTWLLVERAEETGATIIVPTGALVGLDAVQGAARGRVDSVRMITRKPVAGLKQAPYVIDQKLNLDAIDEPLKLFEGSAREAIRGFPANLNVAVALSLAGIGPDRTEMEVWADPNLEFNTHRILVNSDSVKLDLKISNVPSENPATGRLTALSVVALLRKIASPLRVGT